MNRRDMLVGTGGAIAITLLPKPASATPEEMRMAVKRLFGDRPINDGRVSLKAPAIAENGNSVPVDIRVESPMTEDDHVTQIALFAEANPLPDMIHCRLSPAMGEARLTSRVRLGDTQTITAIAEMSDGTLWSGTAETVVTLAACVLIN